MKQWYIVKNGRIVNAIQSAKPKNEVLSKIRLLMVDGDDLEITDSPSSRQLSDYRYWDERP